MVPHPDHFLPRQQVATPRPPAHSRRPGDHEPAEGSREEGEPARAGCQKGWVSLRCGWWPHAIAQSPIFPPQCVRVRAPCHSTRRPHEGGENGGGANHFCVPGRDGGRVPEQTGHGTHAAVLRSPTLCCDVSFSPALVPPHCHSKRARVALLATPCSRPQAPKSPT